MKIAHHAGSLPSSTEQTPLTLIEIGRPTTVPGIGHHIHIFGIVELRMLGPVMRHAINNRAEACAKDRADPRGRGESLGAGMQKAWDRGHRHRDRRSHRGGRQASS